jgi:hypothetical protein
MKREQTVGNCRFLKERPKERERILREKLIPDVVISRRGAYFWDGRTARTPDGRTVVLSDECALELLVLAKNGAFGDLSKVVLDWNEHAVIRESLERKIPHSIPQVREWEPNA